MIDQTSLVGTEFELASARLLEGLESRLAPWLVRRGVEIMQAWRPGAVDPDCRTRLEKAAASAAMAIAVELGHLLGPPAAEQWTSPLDLVRRGLGPVTDVLRAAGVPPVVRDADDERRFPDDRYGLAPVNWGEIDPELVEPGLVWGAAKARAHLADRAARPASDMPASDMPASDMPASDGPLPAGQVVAYAPDLMDQSRLRAAGVTRFAPSPAALVEGPVGLALVDVSRPGVLDVVGRVPGRVIGFFPHVDDELARAARSAGCDEVLPRSVFFRRVAALVAAASGAGTRLSP